MHLEPIAVVVDDYGEAIEFYVGALGFELDVAGNRWDLLG